MNPNKFGFLCGVALLGSSWLSHDLFAQEFRRFDVTASVPLTGATGSLLTGNNPNAAAFGFTVTPGCLVQLIGVGSNGSADNPQSDGRVGGDDVLIATSAIGNGIAPDKSISGQFSTSFYPAPSEGTMVYVRVFDGANVGLHSHWGQSALYTVASAEVMDVSALGLTSTAVEMMPNHSPVAVDLSLKATLGIPATLQILGPNSLVTDADGDALTISAVTQGAKGSVTTDGSKVTYTAASSAAGDAFSYTVNDGFGGTDTRTVTVTITTPAGYNQLSTQIQGADLALTLVGIAGTSYALDRTFNLTSPITWEPQITNVATIDGSLSFTNTPQAETNNFFRTRRVP